MPHPEIDCPHCEEIARLAAESLGETMEDA